MKFLMALVGILLLIGLLSVIRRRGKGDAKRPQRRKQLTETTSLKFHAVSLKFPQSACAAAKALEDRRFLSNAAPRLPLDECDALECKCRFVHHKDRRTGSDRRRGRVGGLSDATGTFDKDKRRYTDRRSDEPDDYFS